MIESGANQQRLGYIQVVSNQPHTIPQFELSPLAKAGVLIRNMQYQRGIHEHAVSAPHRDNHYLLMVATHGRFVLNLDFNEVSFTAPALLVVVPQQVHYVIETTEPAGWGISFDPSLLDNEFGLVLERRFNAPLLLERQTAFYQQTVALLELIEKIQSGAADTYTGRATHALLNALLSLIAGQFAVAPVTTTMEGRGTIIEQAFNQLLKQHYKSWKHPAQYAAEMAISVSHLNDTVKRITGIPISTHIQQRSILEAKRLLYFTDLSVKEISYGVGYDEPVHFGKLFKKATGFTPLHFRQQFRD